MRLALLAFALALPFAAHAERAKTPKFEEVNSSLLTSAPLKSDYVMGKKDAPVTLVEYASLSCPHCAHFHKDVLPQIKKNYIDTGKVNYVLRQFPLNDAALKGALLVDCVGEEGGANKYYTFVDVLFNGQNNWAMDANYLASLETFAKVGGVNKENFDKCMSDSSRELKLLQVRKDATDTLKVSSTPSLFIDNIRFDADMTYENIAAQIDKRLPAPKGEKAAKKE